MTLTGILLYLLSSVTLTGILLYLLSSVTLTGILLYLLSSVSVSNLHLKKYQILSKRFIFSRRYGVGEGGSEQRGPCIIIIL